MYCYYNYCHLFCIVQCNGLDLISFLVSNAFRRLCKLVCQCLPVIGAWDARPLIYPLHRLVQRHSPAPQLSSSKLTLNAVLRLCHQFVVILYDSLYTVCSVARCRGAIFIIINSWDVADSHEDNCLKHRKILNFTHFIKYSLETAQTYTYTLNIKLFQSYFCYKSWASQWRKEHLTLYGNTTLWAWRQNIPPFLTEQRVTVSCCYAPAA